MSTVGNAAKVLVAGHVCLDLIPDLSRQDFTLNSLQPGNLYEVGTMKMALGGAVANTGIALQRLGIPVRLAGKIGKDHLGIVASEMFQEAGLSTSLDAGGLELRLLQDAAGQTSYSVVLSLTDTDRMFFHHPGVNNTFVASDIPDDMFDDVTLFHFGYPPLMREMYLHDGRELQGIFQRAKNHGVITSLDMALPDQNDLAADVDWRSLLSSTLPHVDLFFPSIDEAMFFLNRPKYMEFKLQGGELVHHVAVSDIKQLADEFIHMGARLVAIKLGDQGLYVQSLRHPSTSTTVSHLTRGPTTIVADSWIKRELLAPPFHVKIVGTTGAGDCTIAGFIAGLVHGMTLEECMTTATAVGACSVEQKDATSGVLAWEHTLDRISAGWQHCEIKLPTDDWTRNGPLYERV